MKERIKFLFTYFSFWVVYFLSARIIFLSYHIADTKLLTIETLYGVFFNGIRMDLSMAAYLSVFPFFWVSFSNFIKKSIFQNTIFSYTFIMIFIVNFITVIDCEVYNIWAYRIDATPLMYLKTPKEAFASIKSSPILQLCISFIALLIVSSYFVYRIISDKIDGWNTIKTFPFLPISLFLSLALIIPIRGGFGIAPMNQSTVYFSESNFANISAINATWNFSSSLINNTNNKVNPFTYLPKKELNKSISTLFPKGTTNTRLLSSNKPNVIIITWESFTKKVLDTDFEGKPITPFFNTLKNEGIYFDNVYATGNRTEKGLSGVISGYPAIPINSIIKEPKKSASLPFLSKSFESENYRTEFYYGGDTEFANMKSYLFSADFGKIVDKNEFTEDQFNSKWGVHDNYLFDRFLIDHQNNQNNRPFFSTILTLSSHEPFETPIEKYYTGEDDNSLFFNSLNFTDKCLEDFITKAKKTDWWKNTVIIIIGDHGHRLPITKNKIDEFKTPMLWIGGALQNNKSVNHSIVSQIDISKTLLNQLGLPSKEYIWSKDIYASNFKPWAYFAFNNGFGIIDKNGYFVFDNIGKKTIQKAGPNVKELELLGKAFQQKSYQDYVDR
jgi:phosphoglycerol transferase MdoB-like AlkP superfamily enzyme